VNERDRLHFSYIRESIELIDDYTASGKEDFFRRPLIQDAVLRRLETLADAATKLPADVKERHPEIPWEQLRAFRNIAAHGYREIDLQRVWQTVDEDLRILMKVVDRELPANC